MINKRWFLDRLAERKQSQRALARYMELDASAITHVLNGKRRMQLPEAEVIARFIAVPVDEVLRHAGINLKHSGNITCPLVGTVDSLGIVHSVTGLQVAAPLASMSALQVQAGMSSLDGMLIFYKPQDSYAPEILLGKIAVIEQPDYRRVGVLRRGLSQGQYTISIVGQEIEYQSATAASPVVWIKP